MVKKGRIKRPFFLLKKQASDDMKQNPGFFFGFALSEQQFPF